MSHSTPDSKHKNDIYGSVDDATSSAEQSAAIAAATVALLRDSEVGPQVLMLRKNSKIAFGGMWVFPGGRIDADDFPPDGDKEVAARNAATREAQEEAGIDVDPLELIWFAHWMPPPSSLVRFATWFFAARASDQAVNIDDGEIKAHQWIRPTDALAKHARGEIDLAPPTWVTLHHFARYESVAAALRHCADRKARFYETRLAKREDGVRVALWQGDAGYDSCDANRAGPRHRLVMAKDGFAFENDVADE